MRTHLSALATVALLASAAGAGAADVPRFTAQRAEWQEAEASVDLLALRDHDGGASARLSAAFLHVRAVHADVYARSPTSGLFFAPDWTVEEDDLSSAVLEVGPGRAESFLYVLPSQVSVTMPCGAAEAVGAAEEPARAPSQVESPNPHPFIPLSSALRLRPCGPVEVCGSFTVVLWERDVAGSSAEGAVRLESGQLPREGEPDARPFLGSARQLHLTATDGCLAMDGGAGEGPEVLASGARLGSVPALALRSAQGTLPGGAATIDGDVLLTGRIDATLARDGAAVGVTLAGALEGAVVGGGLRIGLGTTAAAPAVPGWAWALALGLTLPGALLALLLARRNRSDALWRRAERAARGHQWGRVLHLTTRRLRRGEDARTRILRANALLALEDLREALAQARLALVKLPDGPTKADAALVACRAASRLGRDSEALAWLGEVYAQDVRTAEHALRFPEVARLTTAQDVSYS